MNDIESIAFEKMNMTILGENLMALDNCSCCTHISELGVEPAADSCVWRDNNYHNGGLSKVEQGGIAISLLIIVVLIPLIVGVVVYTYIKRRCR